MMVEHLTQEELDAIEAIKQKRKLGCEDKTKYDVVRRELLAYGSSRS